MIDLDLGHNKIIGALVLYFENEYRILQRYRFDIH
jgi:hypothetical protein